MYRQETGRQNLKGLHIIINHRTHNRSIVAGEKSGKRLGRKSSTFTVVNPRNCLIAINQSNSNLPRVHISYASISSAIFGDPDHGQQGVLADRPQPRGQPSGREPVRDHQRQVV